MIASAPGAGLHDPDADRLQDRLKREQVRREVVDDQDTRRGRLLELVHPAHSFNQPPGARLGSLGATLLDDREQPLGVHRLLRRSRKPRLERLFAVSPSLPSQ